MRITTALNYKSDFERRVHGIYQNARLTGASHSHILETLQTQIYSDPGWERVPAWVRDAVTQAGSRELAGIYQPELSGSQLTDLLAKAASGVAYTLPGYAVHRLRVDGYFMTCDQIIQAREAGDDNIWLRVEGAFVWSHKPERNFTEWRNQSHTRHVREVAAETAAA